MRDDWMFDATRAEVAYRTEQLYRARGTRRSGGGRWWKLGRRTVTVPVPEQRRASHDRLIGIR